MKKFESVLSSSALIMIVGVFFNVCIMFITFFNDSVFSRIYLMSFVVCFLLSFILLPLLLINRFLGKPIKHLLNHVFDWKRTVILFPIVFLLSLYLAGKAATIEYFIVAFGEEFLFRHLILMILMSAFNKKWSFIIGSLMFALILHLNGNFLINLLTNFPISLLLYYLYHKYKLQDAIFLHWLYNVFVYRFS